MSEDVSNYVSRSPFANQFDGDTEIAGQLMDVLLRKHYTELSFNQIMNYFGEEKSDDVEDALEVFIGLGMVVKESGGYRVVKDNEVVQDLREEQTDMM